MVVLVLDQQLGPLEVPGADPAVVVLVGQVKLPQSPVDDPHHLLLVVVGQVLGFYVSVHNAHRVAVVQSLQHLVQVEFAVLGREGLYHRPVV